MRGVLVVSLAPETNRNPVTTRGISFVLGGYARLLRSGKFRRYVLAGSCAGTSLYAFLAVAPFLYIELLHRSPQEVGLFCVIVSMGMAVGAMLVRLLVGRMELRRGARLGNLICVIAAFSLLGFDLAGMISVVTLTGATLVYALGVGIAGPNIVTGAMSVDPSAPASTASARWRSGRSARSPSASGTTGAPSPSQSCSAPPPSPRRSRSSASEAVAVGREQVSCPRNGAGRSCT